MSTGNAFERHGIDHLSISSVGLFANEPALWVAERLLGEKAPVGAAAHRGTAAETGIVAGLMSPGRWTLEDCQKQALAAFDDLTALCADPRKDKEREGIAGLVTQGLKRLLPQGVPSVAQQRITVNLPGVPVPWLGFLDLGYAPTAERAGVVVDIKTTLRMPSEPSRAHCRQVALYCYGTRCTAQVAYVTPSKSEVYAVEGLDTHIADLVNVANRLERFLSLSDDPRELASVVVPNVDSFYYSDPVTRAMALRVFGL